MVRRRSCWANNMGGLFGKAMDPIGAIAPGLSPAKIAAKKFDTPALDPTNIFKQQNAQAPTNTISAKTPTGKLLGE